MDQIMHGGGSTADAADAAADDTAADDDRRRRRAGSGASGGTPDEGVARMMLRTASAIARPPSSGGGGPGGPGGPGAASKSLETQSSGHSTAFLHSLGIVRGDSAWEDDDDHGAMGNASGGREAKAGPSRERRSLAGVDGAAAALASSAASAGEGSPIFESSFDLTTARLRHIFNAFDLDQDDRISYEALRRGLKDWAGLALDEPTFKALVGVLDSDASGDVSFEEFCDGVRVLMLRALFGQRVPAAAAAPVRVLDYDPMRLEDRTLSDEADAQEFMHTRRDPWVKMRWIDVVGANRDAGDEGGNLTMKRLAIKYVLHPLALEDALSTEEHRPKIEEFATHYFLIVPVFEVTGGPAQLQGGGRARAVVDGGSADSRAVVTVLAAGDDAPSSAAASAPLRSRGGRGCGCCCAWPWCGGSNTAAVGGNGGSGGGSGSAAGGNRPALRITHEDLYIFFNVPLFNSVITFMKHQDAQLTGTTESWKRRLVSELKKSYSKLRQYDAQYMVYSLLDACVDRIPPIVQRMRAALERERDELRRTKFREDSGLIRVKALQLELEKVLRKCKPFANVLINTIQDDNIVPDATMYLRDVRDNLGGAEDDIRQLIAECQSLDGESEKHHARAMDSTLYKLTVVSSIFLPAQFLTGVWGMNFVDMPELKTSWGYPVFWALTVVMTCSLLLAFNFGRLRRPAL